MRAMTGSGEALLNSFKISAMLMGNPPCGKNLPADYPNSPTLANTRDSFKALEAGRWCHEVSRQSSVPMRPEIPSN
jgi:hypothetical protein